MKTAPKLLLALLTIAGFAVYARTASPSSAAPLTIGAPVVAQASSTTVSTSAATEATSSTPNNIPQATPQPAKTVAVSAPATTPASTPAPAPTPAPTPVAEPTPAAAPAGRYKDGTYTGTSVDVFYGFVQVRATIAGGKLTDVTFLSYPTKQRESIQINQYAMPRLVQQALASQSAQVSGVSGATDTTIGFTESLAAALAQA